MESLSHCEREHKICRICLKNDLLVSIFSATFLMQPIIMIEKLHIFKFQAHDNLPTLLCQSCLYRLLDAFNLQQLAEASELQLRKYLSTSNQECLSFSTAATAAQTPIALIATQGQELSKDADATVAIYANTCEMFERNVHAPNIVETVPAADDVLNDVEIDVSSLTRSEADDTLNEVLVGGHISCNSEAPGFVAEVQSENNTNALSRTDICENELILLKCGKRVTRALKTPDKCLVCGKVFKYSGYLEVHQRIHSGEKPFKCKICTRRFTQSSNLRLHQRTHTDAQRRFQCEVCAAFFTTSSNLKAHALIHTERRDFQCQRCESSFKSERELRRHEPVHKATKDIVCELCQKGFTKRRYLSAHMAAVHQGIRRYKCAECSKVFGTKSNLVCHARIHSGEKPFKCSTCPWKFNQSSALVRHMKKHSTEGTDSITKRQQEPLMPHSLVSNYLEEAAATTVAATYAHHANYNLLQTLPHSNVSPMGAPAGINNQLNETALSGTESTLSSAATLPAYDFTKHSILNFSTSEQQQTQTPY